ncbi:Sodium/myo-inositol cotransporter [Candidatus Burkholderia humilis]|nr:Sodium/myo-inositol cotransporter [Candidatus Burkholderia humilis]
MAFTILSFIFFTGLVALVSYFFTRKAKDHGARGYFMASGGLTDWFIAGSMMLTNLSAEQMVGLNGDAYAHNLSAMAWECTAAVATVALAMFFLPRYLCGGFTTLPQFLEERFDGTTRRVVSAFFVIGYMLVANPSGLYLGSITFNQVFGVQSLLGTSYPVTITLLVWVSGIIGALYAIFGGLRAVAVSDTINGIGLLIAGLMVPLLVSDVLPWWAKGFFIAVLFGTVMSHFNAVINSTATLIVFDFYKVWNDEKLIRVGKMASVIITVVSLMVAPLLMYAPEGIYTVMRRFTGFYNIPIIAVVLVGFFSKKIGAFPAKAVLLLHVIVYTFGILIFQVGKKLGIHFIHIMGILFVCEVALMLALGRWHRRTQAYQPPRRQTGDLTPWRHASTMSVFLLAALVYLPDALADRRGASRWRDDRISGPDRHDVERRRGIDGAVSPPRIASRVVGAMGSVAGRIQGTLIDSGYRKKR